MKSLIVANWKMNPETLKQAKKLVEDSKHIASLSKGVTLVIAPPSVFLRDLAGGRGKVAFAAQNAHFEEKGSFTGEISMAQVKDTKATHVILGHAERRAMGESDEDVRKKVAAALKAELTPILCVGEKSRDAGAEHFDFVRNQLRVALTDVSEKKISKVIIAYEPVWAIGATKAMEPRQMHEMAIFIRKTIVERFGTPGHSMRILYGGSIDATNTADMLRNGDVSGLLVGRASVDAKLFTELVRAASDA